MHDLIGNLAMGFGVALSLQNVGLCFIGCVLGTAIGVKGQGLDPTAPGRLREAAGLIAAAGLADRITLAADGGIREQTVPQLRAAGADTIVMGSLAFGAPDLAARIAWVQSLEKAA